MSIRDKCGPKQVKQEQGLVTVTSMKWIFTISRFTVWESFPEEYPVNICRLYTGKEWRLED